MTHARDDGDEVERALRRALLAAEDARAETLVARARAQAMADELMERLAARAASSDGRPASDGATESQAAGERESASDEATESEAAIEARLASRAEVHLEGFRQADAVSERRLQLGEVVDKYALPPLEGPPCAELIPLCGARCCGFDLWLSTQDLDEGVVAWERARPYRIRHREDDGKCVHLGREDCGCGVYAHRPAPCRTYDCRNDPRIWLDYEARVLAPPGVDDPMHWGTTLDLHDRLRRRDEALAAEATALRATGERRR